MHDIHQHFCEKVFKCQEQIQTPPAKARPARMHLNLSTRRPRLMPLVYKVPRRNPDKAPARVPSPAEHSLQQIEEQTIRLNHRAPLDRGATKGVMSDRPVSRWKRMPKRVAIELNRLQSSQPDGVFIYADTTDSLDLLHAQIEGPPDSPYEGGLYRLEIKIPRNYPFEPPAIRFETKVYHPNIDSAGRICLDILKMPPTGQWKPSLNLGTTCMSIRVLMGSPNPDDPLDVEIAREYSSNRAEFLRKAQEWTSKYAAKPMRVVGITDAEKENSPSKDRSQIENVTAAEKESVSSEDPIQKPPDHPLAPQQAQEKHEPAAIIPIPSELEGKPKRKRMKLSTKRK